MARISLKQKRNKNYPKDEFGSQAEFLEHARKEFSADVDADKDNTDAAIEDSEFAVGKQWDDAIEQRRTANHKPVITINRLPAFIAQIVGNRRLNETVIKILPENGGTKEVARIREGLARNIQKTSHADRAYDKALENQVICGIGNFQVKIDYADDDVFDQDIRILPIPNPFAVVWDRNMIDPTGQDADHVFVVDMIEVDDFKRLYPEATITSELSADPATSAQMTADRWLTQETVRVVSYWRMGVEERVLAMMQDGDVRDITDELEELDDGFDIADDFLSEIALGADGEPMMRETLRKYAELYVITGADVLEGPYRLWLNRVPVFRVPGWEINVGDEVHRFGLVRFLKDPQRLHNYWRSVLAEKLMMAPKARWVASDAAVAGREQNWRNAHLQDDPLLVYNGDSGQPPVMTPPVQMEPALIQEAGMAAQDIKDVSNLHEASLGQTSNEVSGKAITARQRVGETGTILYHDNLNAAIEECGSVINQLIPTVYDAPRIIKILGPDDKDELVSINGFQDEDDWDITAGKYSVTVTTGPSYVTKRVEAAENMLNLINAMPQVMGVAADKIVEAQDWPDADGIAARLRTVLPPNAVPVDELTQEEQQQRAAAAQQAQKQAQLQERGAVAEVAEKEAKAKEAVARAGEAEARARATIAGIPVDQQKADADSRLKAAQTAKTLSETQISQNDALLRLDQALQAVEPTQQQEMNNGR